MTDDNNAFDKAQKSYQESIRRMQADHDKLVATCPYETKLAVVAWAMKHIVEHAEGGGSFRGLIYERLGFDVDAYVPLYLAGGMTISNEFVVTQASEKDAEVAKRLLESFHPNGQKQKTVVIEGGKEPWLTVCEAAGLLNDLSAALAAEQEKRARLQKELDDLQAERRG